MVEASGILCMATRAVCRDPGFVALRGDWGTGGVGSRRASSGREEVAERGGSRSARRGITRSYLSVAA